MDLGSSRGSNLCAWADPPVKRNIGSGGSGESGACRLPPLPRPPSAEDIEAARRHLRLLKAKMPQRSRLQRQLSADPAPRGCSPTDRRQRGHSVPPRPGQDSCEQARHSNGSSRHDAKVRSQSPKRRSPREKPMDTQVDQDDLRRHRQDVHSQQGMEERGKIPGSNEVPVENPPSGNQSPPMPANLNLPSDAFGEDAPVELVECEGCGRKFRPEALERHAKICKKVFQDKRKKFNSAANRLGELENSEQLIKEAKKIEKEVAQVKQQDTKAEVAPASKEDNGKLVPAWKKQSLEFRAAMLASRAATGDESAQKKVQEVNKELKAMGGDDAKTDPTKTQCPHCGRTFNKESAERHIAICLKTFGSKAGGGRLVRGGGKSCNPPSSKSAPTTTKQPAARNVSNSVQPQPYPSQQARRAPPLPGGRR